MAIVNTTIKCTICEADVKVYFTKPSAFQPSIVKATCWECETHYMYRILHKTGEQRGIKIETKVVSMTDAVREKIAIKIEEQKKKAAEKAKKAIAELNQNKEVQP